MKIPFMDRFMGGRSEHPDHTVESVGLNRYAGKWYEIAAFPAWFEKGCQCSTAEYIHMDDYVEVTNTCRREGRLSPQTASPHPVHGTNNSQLRVRFIWPFQSDYWIIALDEHYQYAMVGHPEKKYLWIISRTPHMDDDTYQSLVKRALAQGYDVHRLERTDQSCLPNVD